MVKHSQGIGLLELMLSLSVISVFIVAGMQLLPRVMQHHRMHQMLKIVQMAQGASARYIAVWRSHPSSPVLSVDHLVRVGWLPASMKKTPWGKRWTLHMLPDATRVRLSIPGLKQNQCLALAGLLRTQQLSGQCLAGHYTGEFEVNV